MSLNVGNRFKFVTVGGFTTTKQVKVVNENMDESFGVLEIHVTYKAGNAIKN